MFYIYIIASLGGNIMTRCTVTYSEKQDRFNFISHLLGIPVGVAIFVFALVMLIKQTISLGIFIGLLVFSFTAIGLYIVSALYHHADQMSKKKKIRRIIDHCTIYALIAGTYTPICIYMMDKSVLGLVLLILQWSFAIIGIIINLISLDNKVINQGCCHQNICRSWRRFYLGGYLSYWQGPD